MPLIQTIPEAVPFQEVVDVLAEAASRVRGGPPAHLVVTARQLASALDQAGFEVVRKAASGAQLTL